MLMVSIDGGTIHAYFGKADAPEILFDLGIFLLEQLLEQVYHLRVEESSPACHVLARSSA